VDGIRVLRSENFDSENENCGAKNKEKQKHMNNLYEFMRVKKSTSEKV